MPLPNFFVIGAPKAGTTALYESLSQHPEIYMPALKEPHFYSHRRTGAERALRPPPRRMRSFVRVVDAAEYRALFSGAGGHRAIGEASCTYLRSAVAAQRIQEEIPHAKLVAVLRHPVERAYSSYWFYVMRCQEPAPSFEEALARESLPPRERPWLTHFGFGLYHAHLSPWFARFPREQFRIHLYEDWCAQPQEMLRDVFGFLEVDDHFRPKLRKTLVTEAPRSRRLHRLANTAWLPGLDRFNRRHNLAGPPPMGKDTWLTLHARYRDDIEQLQTLLDRDLSHWLDPSGPPSHLRLDLGS